MKPYQLLLQNGLIIDPSKDGRHERADIAISNGLVAEVANGISADKAVQTFDMGGRMVTPGMVDLHVHVFEGGGPLGIDPDESCLKKGATTVLDAGSTGAENFPAFRRYVIEVSDTRIFALLNISCIGMMTLGIGELEDIRYVDTQKAIRMCEANKDVIMGIKVRLSKAIAGKNGSESLRRALETAEAVGRPIMVHIGDSEHPLTEILPLMRKGDVLTHSFTGLPNGILDKDGNVIPVAREAIARGVIFDVGHGRGSFSFDVAKKALAQNVEPGTISSDLHTQNINGPVFDLATTASKFVHLGLPVEKVLAKVTSAPAEFLGLGGKVGTLRLGAQADIVAFDDERGSFEFEDSYGNKEVAERRLRPAFVTKDGKVHLNRVGTPA